MAPSGAIPLGHGGAKSQDRGEGGRARARRDLPDGRGSGSAAAVRGDPGADEAASVAENGAGMTAGTRKADGEGESDGEGLRRPALNALAEVRSRGVMVRERPDCPVVRQKRRNRMLGPWLESSERATAVAGHRSSGKSRNRGRMEVMGRATLGKHRSSLVPSPGQHAIM